MDPAAKLQLALAIESLGVDRIETGFPASSASDYEATRLISRHLVDATFASFCRAVPSDITVAVSAGGTARHQIQIAATGSDIHLEHKRRISRAEGSMKSSGASNMDDLWVSPISRSESRTRAEDRIHCFESWPSDRSMPALRRLSSRIPPALSCPWSTDN